MLQMVTCNVPVNFFGVRYMNNLLKAKIHENPKIQKMTGYRYSQSGAQYAIRLATPKINNHGTNF